jgi:hypothetical protein
VSDASADAALRHLVSWGLVGGPSEPIDLVGIAGLAALAESHRMTGVVLAALDDGAATSVPDGLIDDLADRHLRLLQQSMMAEADLVFVARLFHDAGIEFRVLKGCATAHLDYPDPALRLTSDVDVLVRRGQLDAATEVLRPYVDHRFTSPDRASGWTAAYGKDRTMRLKTGGWIDLHQMLRSGYYGLSVESDELFDAGRPFVVGGTRVLGLSDHLRLVHSMLHAGMVRSVGMHSIRDIPVILEQVEFGQALETMKRSRVEGLAARGILHTWSVLELAEGEVSGWATGLKPDLRQRIALRLLDRPTLNEQWTGFLGVRPTEVPRYLWVMAFPAKEYLETYGRSRSSHLRRVWQR